ncbi:MAG TPA: hypothetical protein VMF62_13535 [Acetobacteraceae bacterium]|nr:hypothetical protein [Acetobacteraceae bacterium]
MAGARTMKRASGAVITLGVVLIVAGIAFVTVQQLYNPQPAADPQNADMSITLWMVREYWRGIAMVGAGVVATLVGALTGGRFG